MCCRLLQSASILFALTLVSCDRAPAPSPAATNPDKPTIASLVPAATDLIVAMGAADQLLAISNYCPEQLEAVQDLPRVGDYQAVDWERLRQLRPDVMVIFQAPDRVSPGMKQSADELGIRLANIRVDTIEDFVREIRHLGELLDQPAKAEAFAHDLQTELDALELAVRDRPRVPTLIIFNDRATETVGRGTYHDQLLTLAGGSNVVDGERWLKIDRERLLSLQPEAIVVLLAAASPHVEAEARRTLEQLQQLPAVRNGRVLMINRWYTVVPGSHLGQLAGEIARFLHPDAFPPPAAVDDIDGLGAAAEPR